MIAMEVINLWKNVLQNVANGTWGIWNRYQNQQGENNSCEFMQISATLSIPCKSNASSTVACMLCDASNSYQKKFLLPRDKSTGASLNGSWLYAIINMLEGHPHKFPFQIYTFQFVESLREHNIALYSAKESKERYVDKRLEVEVPCNITLALNVSAIYFQYWRCFGRMLTSLCRQLINTSICRSREPHTYEYEKETNTFISVRFHSHSRWIISPFGNQLLIKSSRNVFMIAPRKACSS